MLALGLAKFGIHLARCSLWGSQRHGEPSCRAGAGGEQDLQPPLWLLAPS